MAGVPTEAPGPAARVAGFMSHLRMNGLKVGPADAAATLEFLVEGEALDPGAVRLGFKALLTADREEWDRFNDLFEAYWLKRGKVRDRARPKAATQPSKGARARIWDHHLPPAEATGAAAADMAVQEAGDDAEGAGTGRLVASRQRSRYKADLRSLVDPEDLAEAERIAARLAAAMRYRLTRRRRAARQGRRLDFRRTLRRNLSRGAEPVDLVMRERPDRPVNLVVLVDVSGSMERYARVFLSFVRGLLGGPLRVDAYLFHTRLVRVTEAFKDSDPMRAMARLSLLAEGFGGGTRIAACLEAFNDAYAKRALDSRSVVMILSDGYDTDPPERLAPALARLKTRARRLVWLNPLLGWRDYAPVARGMAAALPHVDLFASAHSLDSLAALEPELARL
jgi:uncharacterized protein with von Willebrand factor type A (vWA) domain